MPVNTYYPDDVIQNAEWTGQLGNTIGPDCGAAAILGPLLWPYNAIPRTTTVADVYRSIAGTEIRGLYLWELNNYLAAHKIPGKWTTVQSPAGLYEPLQLGKPIVMLIWYKVLVELGLTQFKDFTGEHYIAGVGINRNKLIVHDPYYNNGLGAFASIPMKAAFQALEQSDPAYQVWIPDQPIHDVNAIPTKVNQYVCIAQYGANVRKGPSGTATWIGVLPKGAQVRVDHYVPGDNYSQISDGQTFSNFTGDYVWSGYLAPAAV